jgi:hypothetical protein
MKICRFFKNIRKLGVDLMNIERICRPNCYTTALQTCIPCGFHGVCILQLQSAYSCTLTDRPPNMKISIKRPVLQKPVKNLYITCICHAGVFNKTCFFSQTLKLTSVRFYWDVQRPYDKYFYKSFLKAISIRSVWYLKFKRENFGHHLIQKH